MLRTNNTNDTQQQPSSSSSSSSSSNDVLSSTASVAAAAAAPPWQKILVAADKVLRSGNISNSNTGSSSNRKSDRSGNESTNSLLHVPSSRPYESSTSSSLSSCVVPPSRSRSDSFLVASQEYISNSNTGSSSNRKSDRSGNESTNSLLHVPSSRSYESSTSSSSSSFVVPPSRSRSDSFLVASQEVIGTSSTMQRRSNSPPLSWNNSSRTRSDSFLVAPQEVVRTNNTGRRRSNSTSSSSPVRVINSTTSSAISRVAKYRRRPRRLSFSHPQEFVETSTPTPTQPQTTFHEVDSSSSFILPSNDNDYHHQGAIPTTATTTNASPLFPPQPWTTNLPQDTVPSSAYYQVNVSPPRLRRGTHQQGTTHGFPFINNIPQVQHSLDPVSTIPRREQPSWTDQFAYDVTKSINAKVMMMVQNSNLPRSSLRHTEFTPQDIIPIPDSNGSSSSSSLLGCGTFANVSRVMIRSNTTMNPCNHTCYALKSLRREILSSSLEGCPPAAAAATTNTSNSNSSTNVASFIKAAEDLAREAYLLARMENHPHIVAIKGWTSGGVASYNQYKRHDAFFLVLELLDEETLEDRIQRWNHEESTTLNGYNDSSAPWMTRSKVYDREIEQLTMCRQIANALEYIHSRNIIYRDLKPSNIGFAAVSANRNGNPSVPTTMDHNRNITPVHVKLMDFGLARELPPCGMAIPSSSSVSMNINTNHYRTLMSYDLTSMVGTIRYMAPEVFMNHSYGIEADIYSWSIVSYEILTKQRPFANMNPEQYHTYVCQQGVRPHLWEPHTCQVFDQPPSNVLSTEYLVLLANAWRTDPRNRISLDSIQQQLNLFLQRDYRVWGMTDSMVAADTTAISQGRAATHAVSTVSSPKKNKRTADIDSSLLTSQEEEEEQQHIESHQESQASLSLLTSLEEQLRVLEEDASRHSEVEQQLRILEEDATLHSRVDALFPDCVATEAAANNLFHQQPAPAVTTARTTTSINHQQHRPRQHNNTVNTTPSAVDADQSNQDKKNDTAVMTHPMPTSP